MSHVSSVCWLSFKACWVNLVSAPKYIIMSPGQWREQRLWLKVSMENTTWLPSLQERQVASFGNLTWLSILNTLARGGSIVRHEEMDWEQDQDPTFFPLLIVHVPFQVQCVSTVLTYNRTMGSQWALSNFPSLRGLKQFTHSGGMSHCKFQSITPFPGMMKRGVLSSTVH